MCLLWVDLLGVRSGSVRVGLVITVHSNQLRFFLKKTKNSQNIPKFGLHACRYDNNNTNIKAGKSPLPVQSNRNINNPPLIKLTFESCIRLACSSLSNLYKFYWLATSSHWVPCLACVHSYVINTLNYTRKMTKQCSSEKWYTARTGHTPVIPLALIVHNMISDIFLAYY